MIVRDLLRTRGFKMTPQRELIFSSFFEMGKHVSVDELYDRVRQQDKSVGYSTVWRNLKLICEVGLAEEVNIGDGRTRYDRVTQLPHGHLYCVECKKFFEFSVEQMVGMLAEVAKRREFTPDGFKIEVQGVCRECREKTTIEEAAGGDRSVSGGNGDSSA
jgi:Fur family ferric uptake transcriptional regulator